MPRNVGTIRRVKRRKAKSVQHRKPDELRRDAEIKLRINVNRKAELLAAAERADLPLSAWIERTCLFAARADARNVPLAR